MSKLLQLVFGLLVVGVLASSAQALPLYAARSGRTCDNCHSLPNTWFDPEAVSERKCTLSCMSCHVDPNGGGLRNVSGTYYAETTLPMFGGSMRPLEDEQNDIEDWFRVLIDGEASALPPSSQPSSQPTSGPTKAIATAQNDPRGPGAPPADKGATFFGRPAGGPALMAWQAGRYGDYNADPLLNVGGDFRFGFWSQGPLFFPMQAQVYAAVHPIEHVTIVSSVAARGRRREVLVKEDRDGQPKIGARDLWVMLHELPFMGWVRAGRFRPAFGTRIADHTAYTRRPFGLSQENPANEVVGFEVGAAPNYPFITASGFKTSTLKALGPFDTGDGYGGALTAGWRDLSWQLGVSAMFRRRPMDEGGDNNNVSVNWVWNPWRHWKNVPLTYLGEGVYGTLQRPFSGKETAQVAQYHQIAWTGPNGVVTRLRYDYWDPDVEVTDDELHRPGLGLDWNIVPGFAITSELRAIFPAGGQVDGDLFVQAHGYF